MNIRVDRRRGAVMTGCLSWLGESERMDEKMCGSRIMVKQLLAHSDPSYRKTTGSSNMPRPSSVTVAQEALW